MSTLAAEDILIRTMPTPNPYALKFIINGSFKNDGKATFNAPEECEQVPLARDMFAIDGVKQVHLFQNTLSVTHSGELTNEDLSERVSAVIKSRLPIHDPAFGEQEKKRPVRPTSDNPEIMAIEEILDRTIRPGLQADGGDIEVLSFESNELKITYQGACGGCPSSMAGTLDAIQGILRNELNNESIVVTPM